MILYDVFNRYGIYKSWYLNLEYVMSGGIFLIVAMPYTLTEGAPDMNNELWVVEINLSKGELKLK